MSVLQKVTASAKLTTYAQHAIFGTVDGVAKAAVQSAIYGGKVGRNIGSGFASGALNGSIAGIWSAGVAGYKSVDSSELTGMAKMGALGAFELKPVGALIGGGLGALVAGAASGWDRDWIAAGAAAGALIGWSTSGVSVRQIDLGDPHLMAKATVGDQQIGIVGSAGANPTMTIDLRLLGQTVATSYTLPMVANFSVSYSGLNIPRAATGLWGEVNMEMKASVKFRGSGGSIYELFDVPGFYEF